MIHSFKEVGNKLREGFADWESEGQVKATYWNELVQFSYTNECAYKPPSEWNWFERHSRGTIFNWSTGELVARPFDKFWNWGQTPVTTTKIFEISEKMDGSLGILYRYANQWRIATRGSFVSDQALWATEWFNKHCDLEPENNWTLLFEIIYPENRVVVNYGDWSGLVLIGARNLRFASDAYLSQGLREYGHRLGLKLPQFYPVTSVDILLRAAKTLDANREGFVIRMDDGTRHKIKGDAYLELHHIISNFSFKNVLRSVQDGTVDDLVARCPDHYRDLLQSYLVNIGAVVAEVSDRVRIAFAVAPKTSRKDFALWCKEYYPKDMTYLFAMLDGKRIDSLIYRREFEDK